MVQLKRIRYNTMNACNQATAPAYNLKIYNVIPQALRSKVYEMMGAEGFYDAINDLIQEFDARMKWEYQAGFNGRSGGYLVLYKGGREVSEHKSYCRECGQRNFKSVEESGNVCGRCGDHSRVNNVFYDVFSYPRQRNSRRGGVPPQDDSLGVVLFIVIALVVCSFAGCAPGEGRQGKTYKKNPLDPIALAYAVIGEAEGESYQGKLAVACAAQNRASLNGVYGILSPRVLEHKYSKAVFLDAHDAAMSSTQKENCTFIHGATHWLSKEDRRRNPSWLKAFKCVYRVGGHWFYIKK